MSIFNCILNGNFKKIVITTLLLLVPTGISLQTQAEETSKQLTELTSQSQPSTMISVDINSANAENLAEVLQGVGLKRARAIVAWRQQNGPFKHVDDLLKVKGIGKKTLAANAGRIHLSAKN